MSATTLEAAWDHLVAECAAADVVIETAALIESRALGLALTGGGPFSVNDFRELLPRVRNALISHRLRAAQHAGVIRRVGKTPSTLKSTHAHEINVYRGTK